MKLLDSIAKFVRNKLSHYKPKKLQAPKALDTDVISIIYDDKQREEMALIIKEEINKYKDFYKVFLSDYDGICIGNTRSDLKKPLVIDDTKRTFIIQRPSPYHPKSKEYKRFKREQEKETFRIRSIELFESAISQTLKRKLSFDNMRKYYGNSDIRASFENDRNEKDFYIQLLNNDIYSPIFLYGIRDWENLKLFLELDNKKEFIDRYIEQHLTDILNWAIDIYNDDFYKNNIEIIYEALTLEQNTALIAIMGFYIKMIKNGITSFAPESIQSYADEHADEYANEYINIFEEKFSPTKNFENNKLGILTIIGLVSQILIDIDPTEELNQYFTKKMKEGKIRIYYKDQKHRVAEELAEMLGISKDRLEEEMDRPGYLVDFDVCVIPIVNYIIDIPTIIHEFIHQYCGKQKKKERYSSEIPSVFFQSVSMNYLINNGFEQYERELMDSFSARIHLQYWKNKKILEKAKVTKMKYSNKSNNCVPKIETIEDIKKDIALLNRTFSEKKDDEETISYALGTLFAKRYSNNKNVIERMLQFIKDPEYSLQSLMDDIQNEEKNKTIEEEIENGTKSAPSFPC